MLDLKTPHFQLKVGMLLLHMDTKQQEVKTTKGIYTFCNVNGKKWVLR